MRTPTPPYSLHVAVALATFTLTSGALLVHAAPDLTIYNQNFAVVRDTVNLNLNPGLNKVQVSNLTSQVEPDSVVLRDPSGQHQLQVVEQFYRADPISQGLLLSQYEGKTIGFRVGSSDTEKIVQGKIIRSGYTPVTPDYNRTYGNPIATNQPIIEVDGQLRFSLPGEPIFPALSDDAILQPTLNWLLNTDQGGAFNAEMAYITNGMTWKADYNLVAPENSDGPSETLDLTGWVTLSNTTGKTFDNAHIKLMAGDVSRISPGSAIPGFQRVGAAAGLFYDNAIGPTVTQKNFDDYHLYTLTQNTTLRDRETKQVEFTRAASVKATRAYVYDGAVLTNSSSYGYQNVIQDESFGTKSNPKVWVMREFANSEANGLGIPLPKGRLRFYQRDTGGQLEFLGENNIDHTPKDETVKVYTGNAFDIVGERKRTSYKIDTTKKFIDESFEISLRNHKPQAAEVRVVEHLYRSANWTILQKSNDFLKKNSSTIEFRIPVPADGAQTITYTAHYTW